MFPLYTDYNLKSYIRAKEDFAAFAQTRPMKANCHSETRSRRVHLLLHTVEALQPSLCLIMALPSDDSRHYFTEHCHSP